MSSLILGIDFGGTKNSVALVERGSIEWLDHRRRKSSLNASAQSDLATILDMSRELLSINSGKLIAVGVSFGGPVDYQKGTVRLSYHVPGWENYPLRDQLQKEYGVPVSVDNDANAGALGEWYYGAGRNCANLLYITVSTGIGGGWILNGIPYRGANSLAGEIGHILVNSSGPDCACGKKGCLESMASGLAISRRAVSRLKTETGAGKLLRALCNGDFDMITAKMVSQAAEEGDRLSRQVLLDAAHYLGIGIGQVLALMNPERVILGGGVTKAGGFYWRKVYRSASEHSLPGISIDIVPAKLADNAPLWGAFELANQLLLYETNEKLD